MSSRITLILDDSTKEQLIKLAGGPRRVSLYLTGVIKDLDAGNVLKRVDYQRQVATLRAELDGLRAEQQKYFAALEAAEERQIEYIEQVQAMTRLTRGLESVAWNGVALTTGQLQALRTAVELGEEAEPFERGHSAAKMHAREMQRRAEETASRTREGGPVADVAAEGEGE